MALLSVGPWPPAQILEAIRVLSAAAGVEGMVGGQFVDVTASSLGPEGLVRLHELKTGALIGASVEMALAVSGTPEDDRAGYREFAGELGILFQIVDDILDVTGAAEETGKPQGSDERHGKITYVTLHGLDQARRLAAESHGKALESLSKVDGETESLKAVADYIHDRDR